MGSGKSNTFRKAIRHLKSTQIDEKLQLISEIPTNNIGAIYIAEPQYQVQDPDVIGSEPVNFTQDDPSFNGRDTTGLFGTNGSILTIEPPGDTSYILGPMASMWYAWGNFSTIGYIRQSDRRMVDLARISGRLGNWNGTSNFVSYGQLTLEQAVWFRDTPKLNGADNNTPNYRAFYPGPPSNVPDQYGRYLCVITGTPKPTGYTPPLRTVPPVMGTFDPNLPPGSANPNLGKASPDPFGDLAILLAAAGIVGAAALAFKAAVAAGGSAALSAIASRLRYLAKLRMDRGALNPFGQTAVRSGAAGRQRVDVYTGRPYQGPRGNRTGTQYATTNPQTGNTYTNPGPLRGMPGTGSQTNPAGTLDKSTLPQRYIDKYGSRSVLGQQQIKLSPSAARRTFGESVNSTKIDELSNEFIETLFSQYPDPYEKVDELLSNIQKYLKSKKVVSESEEFLSESTKSILKNIKKPYVLPEQPKVKYKVKPGANKTVNADLMKKAEVPSSFKKAEERLWGKYEKEQNARFSQERKNEVLDHLGGGDHAWEYMTETNRQKSNDILYSNFGGEQKIGKIIRKEELKGDTLLFIADENGNKESILQSELSIRLADEFNKEVFEKYFQEQETVEADKDPLFKKVAKKLKKDIDYPDKPSKNGYPNDPPPEMVNGYHPEYGEKDPYYNKLDPQSAAAMPKTGNPKIDSKVEKSKKVKVKESKKSNWKNDIRENLKSYMNGELIQETMTSADMFTATLPATGDADLQVSNLNATEYSGSTDISFNSGTNSGFTGGFSSDNGVINIGGESAYGTAIESNTYDFSLVDTVNITAIAGNNSNGGMTPTRPLELYFFTADDVSDSIQVVPTSASSFTNVNISIPERFRKSGVGLLLFSDTSDGHGYHGRHFRSQTIPLNGLNHTTIGGYDNSGSYANMISYYLRDRNRNSDSDMRSLGEFFWFNVNANRFGWFDNIGTVQNPNLVYRTWPAAPISGATTENKVTDADRIYIGRFIYDRFKGTKLYGISNVSFRRKTPMSVVVPLNSPEATSFIRAEPNLSNLSPQERLQKLKEMLKSSDEYVMKILGADFPGTGAVPPGEYVVPQPPTWEQSAAQAKTNFDFTYDVVTDSGTQKVTQSYSPTTNKSSTSSSISKSADQRTIDTLKKEIETRTKLQTTGDAQKYYSSPSMQKALDRLKVNLAQQEKDFADKYGSTEMPGSDPQELEKQLSDIDKQIKQLEKDNERIKADANRRNWELAANLAMDAATAAAILSPVPGDEAIAIGARTASQAARSARNFQRQNPGKYNPFLSDKANQLARQQGVGTNVSGQKTAFRNPLTNSYKPQGQVIMERKKLKSPEEVLNKIPGYYDGKPAPLGFPVEPPPKMVNGMHSDLVDGKKVADRFNRLDPESAKAMPLTGNPHIDKKVKAARKKPK